MWHSTKLSNNGKAAQEGTKLGTTPMENIMEVPQKTEYKITI